MERKIEQELRALSDETYADFQFRLTPGISREDIIGVRVPILRKYAKELMKANSYGTFLNDIPHRYYDENMLHAMIISELKDFDDCMAQIERFLPYVDNWAVCDCMSPRVLKKDKQQLLGKIHEWSNSKHTYTCRFGLEMLMRYFLDDEFDHSYLVIPARVMSDDYYVNMMIAWFFATALAKQWDASIPYLVENRLSMWVHNKTIQKAVESYRISSEKKEYLRTLKRK